MPLGFVNRSLNPREAFQAIKVRGSRPRRPTLTTRALGDFGREPVRVAFALPYRCDYGQNLSIIGSAHALGGWQLHRCVDMQWSEGDVWRVELEIPVSNLRAELLEYKYIVRNNDGEVAVWKPGDNFSFHLPDVEEVMPEKVRINDAWDGSYRTIEMELRNANEEEVDINLETALLAAKLTQEAEDALMELKTVVEQSSALLEDVSPVSPEALEADKAVASAAEKASELSRALEELRSSGELPNVQL